MDVSDDAFTVICSYLAPLEFIALAACGRSITAQCEKYVESVFPSLLLQQFTSPSVVEVIRKIEVYTPFHYRFIRATTCYCGLVAWRTGCDCSHCAIACDLCERRIPRALSVTLVCMETRGGRNWKVCRFGCLIPCLCCRKFADDPTEQISRRGMFTRGSAPPRRTYDDAQVILGFLCGACRSKAGGNRLRSVSYYVISNVGDGVLLNQYTQASVIRRLDPLNPLCDLLRILCCDKIEVGAAETYNA